MKNLDIDSNDYSMPKAQRILVIGKGGRENALAWALSQSNGVEKVIISPGNGGTKEHPPCHQESVGINDADGLIELCSLNDIQLVVVGPEAPLANGLADVLRKAGLSVFGPGKEGAQLESSKTWAKKLMEEANIPTAKSWTVKTEKEGIAILQAIKKPLVVKLDGLAEGKGVTVPNSLEGSIEALKEAFSDQFDQSSQEVVLEEKLEGPEISIFALCDGERVVLLPPAQDHKRLKDNDMGPNTGGMGAYAPAPLLNEGDLNEVLKSIIKPTVNALKSRNIDYKGVIYLGLMITNNGPKVIEFNCRFGDPETQPLMARLNGDLVDILWRTAAGTLDGASLTFDDVTTCCVVMCSEGYPGSYAKGKAITGIDSVERDNLIVFHAGTKVTDDGLETSGGRVLGVTAIADSLDEAKTQATDACSSIHFDGAFWRKDIGCRLQPEVT